MQLDFHFISLPRPAVLRYQAHEMLKSQFFGGYASVTCADSHVVQGSNDISRDGCMLKYDALVQPCCSGKLMTDCRTKGCALPTLFYLHACNIGMGMWTVTYPKLL